MPGPDVPLADTRDMYVAHAMFRREFGLLPPLVRAVPTGDLDRVAIVADHFELLNNVLMHHHRGEEVYLWPRLLNRAARESASVVETMENQHDAIQKLDVELAAAVETWREKGCPDAAESVAAIMDELSAVLREHMATEEAQALPLVEQHITAAEWEEMVRSETQDVEPELMPLVFGLMMYEADAAEVDEIIGAMSPALSRVLKPLAEHAFEYHSERVHGTTAPPRGTA
jgi:hemerythrin-like domain-containing protein